MPFNNIYNGKTVLITGHAGFKGSWLSFWLTFLGAKVVGYSLLPNTNPRLYEVLKLDQLLEDNCIADICNTRILDAFFAKHNPDIVFHLAAQPLVLYSYSEPIRTYYTNVLGTLYVLEAARKTASVKAFVNITTDKCYENKEKKEGYKEDEPFGGYDMYSSSKGCVEILSSSYRRSFLTGGKPFALATARAGNVIGGGDWSKDRLIPDCIRAFQADKPVKIRNPQATRPWQHVLEPLAGYLRLGQKLLEEGASYADGFNFGPEMNKTISVAEVAQQIAEIWGSGKVFVGKERGLHEANLLQLNIEKSKKLLDISPVYTARQAILKTVQWYKEFYVGHINMSTYTAQQIEEFVAMAKTNTLPWSMK
ncbi:MAG: CDP-glucose 4,6-dehydratase [Elusimicrobiaceae bacterium]|nr:CDP-glucose 4,6-dehydratase [Elusimicrobiaceae bacterium]